MDIKLGVICIAMKVKAMMKYNELKTESCGSLCEKGAVVDLV